MTTYQIITLLGGLVTGLSLAKVLWRCAAWAWRTVDRCLRGAWGMFAGLFKGDGYEVKVDEARERAAGRRARAKADADAVTQALRELSTSLSKTVKDTALDPRQSCATCQHYSPTDRREFLGDVWICGHHDQESLTVPDKAQCRSWGPRTEAPECPKDEAKTVRVYHRRGKIFPNTANINAKAKDKTWLQRNSL